MAGEEGLVVRRANPDDLASILSLYRFLHPDEDPAAVRADIERTWETIQQSPFWIYFLAEQQATAVGTCNLSLVPNLTRAARPFGLIENVVTHPDYRCQGVGSQLLRLALTTAWEAGCYKVMLLTGSKKESTWRFYEQAGFKKDVKTGFIAYPPA